MKRLASLIASIVLFALFPAVVFAQTDLGVAQYTDAGRSRKWPALCKGP